MSQFFQLASVASAAAVAAVSPHYQQADLLHERDIEIVESAICEYTVMDSMLADIAFLDPADPDRINRSWQDRMYALLEERDESLCGVFTAWCLSEERRASRLAESPRLPWQFKLQYPILEISKDGHVHVYRDA